MNPITIGYVPPPTFGQPGVFLDNLDAYPPAGKMLLFSDHDWGERVPVRTKGSPESVKGASPNKWMVNNFIFFTALRVAIRHGATHLLYIECDSRVGRKGWDQVIWDEYFNLPMPAICAGSMVCYNPCNSGPVASRRWAELVSHSNRSRNFPIPTYGHKGAADDTGSCMFVNGSLGVFDMAWMRRLFGDIDNCVTLAADCTAWDMEIGLRIWPLFKEDSYKVVHHLNSVFSSYGDVLTTESQRLEMLKGDVVAVHQVKSARTPNE